MTQFAIATPLQLTARDITHRVTFRDGESDTAPVRDISGSTIEIVFRNPAGVESRETGVIVAPGTLGQATFLDAAGAKNNAVGSWLVWGTEVTAGALGPRPTTSRKYSVVEEGNA